MINITHCAYQLEKMVKRGYLSRSVLISLKLQLIIYCILNYLKHYKKKYLKKKMSGKKFIKGDFTTNVKKNHSPLSYF